MSPALWLRPGGQKASALGRHFSYPRIPIAQRAACPSATAERGGDVGSERTRLSDVLRRHPDGVAIDGGGAVVSPAITAAAHKGLVGSESVLRPQASGGDVDVAGPDLRVQRNIGCAGEIPEVGDTVAEAKHRKGDYPSAAGGHADSGIREIVIG